MCDIYWVNLTLSILREHAHLSMCALRIIWLCNCGISQWLHPNANRAITFQCSETLRWAHVK